MKRTVLAAIAALVLCVGPLAGCTSSQLAQSQTPSPAQQGSGVEKH